MIPKKLHYIWVGNEKPDDVLKCIESFHKFMSDYEITEWNESNIDLNWFNKTELNFYNKNYESGKFAFCSDLIRLYILKRFGGIYVDTDVEFIRHLPNEFLVQPLIARISPTNTVCNGCIWGCEPNDKLVSFMIRCFNDQLILSENSHGKRWIFNTILKGFFDLFGDNHSRSEITDFHGYKVYPTEYFCPMNGDTKKISITDKTISIHHFDLSWKR